eukprot:scaffold231771_cov31-Tisochrysis_lutea.AAC.12
MRTVYAKAETGGMHTMSSYCLISVDAGISGRCKSSSPMMHPTAHRSMGAPYSVAPSRSSGARYHSARARPKSQSLSSPAAVSSRFDILRSRCSRWHEWRCETAQRSCAERHLASSSANGLGIESSSLARSCSQ